MRAQSSDYSSSEDDDNNRAEQGFGLQGEAESQGLGSDEHARMRYVRARDARIARRAAERRDQDLRTVLQGIKRRPLCTRGDQGAASRLSWTHHHGSVYRHGESFEAGEGWMGAKPAATV